MVPPRTNPALLGDARNKSRQLLLRYARANGATHPVAGAPPWQPQRDKLVADALRAVWLTAP